MDNQLLDFVVLVLYFAVMIGAGYWGLRRARSTDDYLVAGRRLGSFMYIGCLAAVVQREQDPLSMWMMRRPLT